MKGVVWGWCFGIERVSKCLKRWDQENPKLNFLTYGFFLLEVPTKHHYLLTSFLNASQTKKPNFKQSKEKKLFQSENGN